MNRFQLHFNQMLIMVQGRDGDVQDILGTLTFDQRSQAKFKAL